MRARVDGRVVQLTDNLRLDRQMRHTIEVVVDRLVAGSVSRTRLTDSIETALKLSGGTLVVTQEAAADASAAQRAARGDKETRSRRRRHRDAVQLAIRLHALRHQLRAAQSTALQLQQPAGHVPAVQRSGHAARFPARPADPRRQPFAVAGGGRTSWGRSPRSAAGGGTSTRGSPSRSRKTSACRRRRSSRRPGSDLPEAARQQFLYGTGDRHITFAWRSSGGVWKHGGTFEGIVAELLESYRKAKNIMRRRQLEKYMEFVPCTECSGHAAQCAGPQRPRHVEQRPLSPAENRIAQPAGSLWAEHRARRSPSSNRWNWTKRGRLIAAEALKEIRGRLGFLLRCGLDYLTLDRSAPTLSGGETQRIRLAAQIGCGLVGVVYILDEPSIGLHARDNALLARQPEESPRPGKYGDRRRARRRDDARSRPHRRFRARSRRPRRRDRGRRERSKISARSPRASPASTSPANCRLRFRRSDGRAARSRSKSSAPGTTTCEMSTSPFRSRRLSASPASAAREKARWSTTFCGKRSTAISTRESGIPGTHSKITGLDHLDKAIDIDQSPIGRTPRSNPATYVKLFDLIRDLFTQLPESKMRGFKPGRFSFNVSGGRCEACEGRGSNRLEMDFLADVWVTCPVCQGHRFTRETLEVRYKGASIADVLEMDVQEALEHFKNIPPIANLLQTLHDVGLDYIKLGQPSPTLSGGEAQRIKLARELGKRSTGRTLYLLDEPTTGLHFADIHKLLEVLHGFVDAGNTVIVVEHNLDVLKTADWIIDLGPEGGAGGGRIVVEGTPEEVAASAESYTGESLRTVLPGFKNGAEPSASRTAKAARATKKKGGNHGPRRAGRSLAICRHGRRRQRRQRRFHKRDRDPRSRAAQSAARRHRRAPREDDRLLRAERQRQDLAGDGHALRRRAAAIRRVALRLRPPIPGPDAQAEGRAHPRPVAGHRHRTKGGRATRRVRLSAP